jgi:beta-lactam-binding protein with PASTA domain
VSAQLNPQTSKGSTVGEHDLTLQNNSQAAVTSTPSATAGQSDVDIAFEPATLTVAPGQSAVTHLRVTPRQAVWLGREQTHQFAVDVAPGLTVQGAMVQQPRAPKWVLAAVPVVLAAILAPTLTFGTGGGSTPKFPVPDVAGLDPLTTALDKLKTACTPSPCFDVGFAKQFNNTIGAGLATGTQPPKDTLVARGSPVTVIVSLGPCPTPLLCLRVPIDITRVEALHLAQK